MTLDEQIERMYDSYFGLKQDRELLRVNPSTDNYDFRKQIPDANGQPMLTQPAGVVDAQLEDYVGRMTQEMNSKVTPEVYESIRSEFYEPLDEPGKRQTYLEIAKSGILPANPSEKLNAILNILNKADGLKQLLAKKDYGQAIALMNSMIQTDLMNKEGALAYQYNLLGQGDNVRALGEHFRQIQYNIAANALDSEVRAEIDQAIADKNAYGVAGAEMYKIHNAYQQQALAQQQATRE